MERGGCVEDVEQMDVENNHEERRQPHGRFN